MKVLITGTAGFIGSHVALALLERGDEVVGIDNLNDYYDVALKKARLNRFIGHPRYRHIVADLADKNTINDVFEQHKPHRVINLAAQAGVRYASQNPHVYISSNVTGFLHILEGCRNHAVEHLVFASTSSVYGANTAMPFSEHRSAEHPLTLYAASKKANEQMAHSYSHLYGIPCTGLRFFTVYGPWGRPDMALFLFTKAILAGEPIKVFNNGHHKRSFTYIDDVVKGIVSSLDAPPEPNPQWDSYSPDPATSQSRFRIFNLGNEQAVDLKSYIEAIESFLGKKAIIELLPLQAGDVPNTEADMGDMKKAFNYSPQISVKDGVAKFLEWYLEYYV